SGDHINGFPILCGTREARDRFRDRPEVKFIFQLYRPDLINERIELKNSYQISLDRYYSFIHPSALVARSAALGVGCVLHANSLVQSNAVIGNFCSLLSASSIGHDTIIGDHTYIGPQAVFGSNCKVGAANFFGMNCTINNYTTIGDNCFIAQASNVIKDIPSRVKVLGNPAKPFDKPIKPL
nr:sialic acid O-acetyltransferase [Bacteroidota bacterium]